MFTNSLAVGTVWHKRYTPKIHEFNYRLNSWLIDIHELKLLTGTSRLLSNKGFNLYTFDESNYIRNHYGNLLQRVRNKFIELGALLEGTEKFFLLGQLKNCGIYFSPLNLYLCFLDKQCTYILAEVSNTPWNERHYYLINLEDREYITKKAFHVSPFWGIKQNYHWKFDISEEKIYFQIDSFQDGGKVFSAGYKIDIYPFTDKFTNNIRIIRQPFAVLKIILAIYYEALKLFSKKMPFIPYQSSKGQ